MTKTISKLLLGGSTGLNLFGDLNDAEQAMATGKYNSNAALRDAAEVEDAGAMSVQQFERQGREFIGTQKATIAAQGQSFSGSAMDILADTYSQLALEKKNMQRETSAKAQALREDAANSSRAGANARTQSYLKAGNTLLTSTKQFLDMF